MGKAITQEQIIKTLLEANRNENPTYRNPCAELAELIKAHGIAPPDGLILVGRDDAESYMQMLYMASNGKANAYAACANEIKAMLAITPKPEDV